MHCNTNFDTNVKKTGSKIKVPDGKEMCVVIRYGLIIRGYLPIFTHFGCFFVFVILVSMVEDYLSAQDHILPAQF